MSDTQERPSRSAREIALQILLKGAAQKIFVQEVLDQAIRKAQPGDADRRLITELVYGTIRRRLTLDTVLRAVVNRPLEQVESGLLEALRLGAYQLLFLEHIPPHAAVHETVDLVETLHRPKARGFINGSLRSISRLMDDEETDKPARRAYPVAPGRFRCLTKPVFANQRYNPVEYLSQVCSLPLWMTTRWHKRYGFKDCLQMGIWFSSVAPLWLRCNPLKGDRETVLAQLKAAEIDAVPGEHPQSVQLQSHVPVRAIPGFDDGQVTVQDESAMHVATLLDPQPGERILDLCAAPGGKTTHMAELMKNQGEICACDIDPDRLTKVRQSAERLGISIIETVLIDSEAASLSGQGLFDRALVDVPCSNTGVLGRRPEARWRLQPDELSHLARLQKKLLLMAVESVKPGGIIVYSTCSIEPEENAKLILSVIKQMPGLTLEDDEEQVPSLPADGGYRARIRKQPTD